MSDQVELVFTDRYGGRTPSWFRSCHGECEAMGEYPVPSDLPASQWEFRKCEDCGGTGRVAWYVAVARIPGCLLKRLTWLPSFISHKGWAPDVSFSKRMGSAFRILFWYDFKNWNN